MRRQKRKYPWLAFSLISILLANGCAVEERPVYRIGGKEYCVTSAKIWRSTWSDYYERGISCAEGQVWDEAIADFRSALVQKSDDIPYALTYGMHDIHYFPNRELGIAYYHIGRHREAIKYLEISLDTADSGRAKYYLNKARQSLFEQTGENKAVPQIVFNQPVDGLLTNNFTLTVAGHVEDDSYVKSIIINKHSQLIELAQPVISFEHEVALHDGVNVVEVVATNLLGRSVQKRLMVYLDTQGPIINLYKADIVGSPPNKLAILKGSVTDHNLISEVYIAGNRVTHKPGNVWNFDLKLPVANDAVSIPIAVEDAAGNVTRSQITLHTPYQAAREARRENSFVDAPLVLARLSADTWDFDVPMPRLIPMRLVQDPGEVSAVTVFLDFGDRQVIADRQVVEEDSIQLQLTLIASRPIVSYQLNEEKIVIRKPLSRQISLSRQIRLKPGENEIEVRALDENLIVYEKKVVVIYRSIEFIVPRLRIALRPFDTKGKVSELSEAMYWHLFSALGDLNRFHLISDQKDGSKDVGVEGILHGKVIPHSGDLAVVAALTDPECKKLMGCGKFITTKDIYVPKTEIPSGLKELMLDLARVITEAIPRSQGDITRKRGRSIETNLGTRDKVKPYMKLVIFRVTEDGVDHKNGEVLKEGAKLLGEAKVVESTKDRSSAKLLPSEQQSVIRARDRVITK